jgi:polyhydroxyalkanoate synthesis regulator phasin
MAWLSGWKQQRIKITIDQTKIDTADLTWFPVTVFLDATNTPEVFTELTTDAMYLKVAFTKADGTTELYGEMELFDVSESKGIFHVSADGWVIDYDADTIFYMYFDSTHADNTTYIGAVNTTAGAAVWDGSFKGVFHLVDATTSTTLDSTNNSHDLTKKGAGEPASATGKVGLGQDFAGDHDYIYITNNLDITTGNETVSVLVNLDANPASSVVWQFIVNRNGASGIAYNICYTNVAGNYFVNFYRSKEGIADMGLAYDYTLTPGTWYCLTMTYDGTNCEGFINGEPVGTGAASGTGNAGESILSIGAYRNGATIIRYIDGKLDEGQVSNVVRTDGWIKATYNSLWNTLQSYTSEMETAQSETLGVADTIVKTGSLAKTEALSLVDTWTVLMNFAETLNLLDSIVKNGSLAQAETLNITDGLSALFAFAESLGIVDTFGTTGELGLAETINLLDVIVKTGSLAQAETLGIADVGVTSVVFALSETLHLIDTLVKSGTLAQAETLSIADTYSILFMFAESLGIADSISTSGAKAVSELLHLIDSYRTNTLWAEESKSAGSWTEETKADGSWTEETKADMSWDEEEKI